MHHSIGRFLLFLGAELLFMVAGGAVMIPLGLYVVRNQTLKNSIVFSLGLSMDVVFYLFLFLFIWILTGENYISLVVFLFVITFGLMLIVELLWLLVGSQNVPWAARTFWANSEYQQRARIFYKTMQILGTIAVPIYFPTLYRLGVFQTDHDP